MCYMVTYFSIPLLCYLHAEDAPLDILHRGYAGLGGLAVLRRLGIGMHHQSTARGGVSDFFGSVDSEAAEHRGRFRGRATAPTAIA